MSKRNPNLCRALKWLTATTSTLLVAGCASQWAPGPGMTIADFAPAKAQCSIMARHGGGGFFAVGTANFVATAALLGTIGEAARTNRDFNDCMTGSGFHKVSPEAVAAVKEKREELRPFNEVRKACIAEIRARPEYAILQAQFSDLQSGQFTVTQLSNTALATFEEARAIASYVDASMTCALAYRRELLSRMPQFAPVVSDAHDELQRNLLRFIHGEISWGAFDQNQEDIQKTTRERMKALAL